MTEPILQVRNLSKAFGGILALNGVTFDVPRGEILAVIGPMAQARRHCLI